METNNNSLVISSMQQMRKSTKKAKSNKKAPVKVVYISNPMKVKTSAAEFRALVQELTGQYAEFPDPSKFPAAAVDDSDVDADYQHPDDSDPKMKMRDDGVADAVDSSSSSIDVQLESSGSTALYDPMIRTSSFEDEAFMPEMLDNISGLFPAALLYHTPQYCP